MKNPTSYVLTKKVTAYSTNELLNFGGKWRLYTDNQMYGKEPIIKEKRIETLLKGGCIKKVLLDRNLAINTVTYKYVFV